jgi:hypothetical protein
MLHANRLLPSRQLVVDDADEIFQRRQWELSGYALLTRPTNFKLPLMKNADVASVGLGFGNFFLEFLG